MSMSKTVLYCKICGKEISALGMPSHLHRKHGLSGKEYYEKYCSKKEYDGVCKICGKPTTFKSIEHGYRTFCSSKCANRDSDVLAKYAATNLERYGNENVLSSDTIKAKIHSTMVKRYGGMGAASSTIAQRMKETNLERYVVENAYASSDIVVKINETSAKRVRQFCEKHKCTPIKDLPFEFAGLAVKESGVTVLSYFKNIQYIYNTDIDKVKQIAATIQQQYEVIGSIKENEVANFVKSICGPLGLEVIQRTRKVISPLELDIYIPSHKLAIEFNGTYWHSENAGMDKFYHKNKTYLCNANGIRLIHIFEYNWNNCKDICKSIILDALNIHTTTYSMFDYKSLPIYDKNIVSNFLHQNSLDGPISDSVIYHIVGLFHNTTNELIQVVCYVKEHNDIFIIRNTTKLFAKVQNGFKCIVDYLRSTMHNIDHIYTHIDNSYQDSSTLECASYELVGTTDLQYKVVQNNIKVYDSNIFKYFIQLRYFNLNNIENSTMFKIYDCGSTICEAVLGY